MPAGRNRWPPGRTGGSGGQASGCRLVDRRETVSRNNTLALSEGKWEGSSKNTKHDLTKPLSATLDTDQSDHFLTNKPRLSIGYLTCAHTPQSLTYSVESSNGERSPSKVYQRKY